MTRIENLGKHGKIVLAISSALLVFGPRAVAADPVVKAGGVPLMIPGPTSDFVESGDRVRTTLFELLVPSTNRLLSAYLPSQALSDLLAGKTTGTMDVYAMAEVPRRAEYTDCTPQIYAQVVKGLEPAMGKLDPEKLGNLEEEINLHLKSFDIKRIQVGQTESLGGVFKKDDAAGFAMLMALKQGDQSTTMAAGIALLRVKQRLVFAYLFRKYESPDTIGWVRKNLEAWADAILTRNK